MKNLVAFRFLLMASLSLSIAGCASSDRSSKTESTSPAKTASLPANDSREKSAEKSQAPAAEKSAPDKPIQVGWMTSWATTGQIMQAMIHTNIPSVCNEPLAFRSFLFGPDINEAALHGEVDCVNSGLVPTISLLCVSDDWLVVGRLVDSPLSVVAHKGSGIRTIADLKGKSLAVPFGGGTHPYVIKLLEDAGLKTGEGKERVNLLNLKPSEQALAMQQGSVDAVGTWEPQTGIILTRGNGQVVDTQRHIGVITVRRAIARTHPERIVRLLKEYLQANCYVANHRKQTDDWFAAAAHMDDGMLKSIKVIEPNMKATSLKAVDLDLTAKDIQLAQQFADTMLKADLISKKVDFANRTDLSFLRQAEKELAAVGYKSAVITVVDDKSMP